MPGTGHQFGNVLQMALEVRRDGRVDDVAHEGPRGGRMPGCARCTSRRSSRLRLPRGAAKSSEAISPAQMAKQVVQQRRVSIRVACTVFGISESCYRYEAKLNTENEEIADWLMRITGCHRNWGFLCYYYLRNVQGFVEPQAHLPDLSGAGAEPAHQAEETLGARNAAAAVGAACHQRSVVNGLHA